MLVAAGAIATILKLIRSISRSIPDQEVLKHALSTLRNLAHYPHLTEILIESDGCVEVVFWEFLRFVCPIFMTVVLTSSFITLQLCSFFNSPETKKTDISLHVNS